MKKLIIFICKCAIFFLKIVGKGTSFPGSLALTLDKKILGYFKMPNIVVAVTGSAGKGSTTKMIAEGLRKEGYKVAHNIKGSNILPGIVSVLLESSKLNGRINSDAVVLEIDERYVKYVFEKIKPNYVVITNICRDQPPRHGHFDLVYEKIEESLTKDMHLILNGDDPYLQKFNLKNEYTVTYYGINKNKYSYDKNKFNNINIYYCPRCKEKLKYNFYHFESVGDYYCPNCSFKRPTIDYISDINLDKNEMLINGNKIDIKFDILYYAYNTLATYATLSLLGIDSNKICNYISELENNTKLNEAYLYKNRKVFVMSSKAENSTTYNQSVLYASNHKEQKTIVLGWKEISRRYEHNDMSWLYDIEFELLNNKNTDKVICVGPQKYDIATRIKYAGFEEKQIEVYENLEEAGDMIKNTSKGNIYAILNFDYVKPFNKLMRGE